ncbi:hypothetical protein HPB51_005080 [Rhipicephalus microplus]|uniref:Uncharacterized protein n=1 Tax=Rhipicephalus microplus TaxID=6941 RepID=A0A9J6DLF8_RHIMP|nr:hypothetical protein HPB51_005080 [Rhipicephalus microplus]
MCLDDTLLEADNGKALTPRRKLDELLDVGNLVEAHEVLNEYDHVTEHADMVVQSSDARLMFYMAGYVARKSVANTKCAECSQQLLPGKNDLSPAAASLTTAVDRGGLLYPSAKRNELVSTLKNTFTHLLAVGRLSDGRPVPPPKPTRPRPWSGASEEPPPYGGPYLNLPPRSALDLSNREHRGSAFELYRKPEPTRLPPPPAP